MTTDAEGAPAARLDDTVAAVPGVVAVFPVHLVARARGTVADAVGAPADRVERVEREGVIRVQARIATGIDLAAGDVGRAVATALLSEVRSPGASVRVRIAAIEERPDEASAPA